MIYITGDCHSDFTRFTKKKFKNQEKMSKEDFIIICGDFGGVWDFKGEDKSEYYYLDWLNEKPWTTLFVDGNHENFERLYAYPMKEWNGGLVHEIRPSVLHLMRGQVFNLQDLKFFTFGGARSHDIRDGILDFEKDKEKIKKWYADYTKLFRINKISWWKEEMPSEEEMEEGIKNLEKHNWNVDFIITHDCSSSTKSLLSKGFYEFDELNNYFEKLRYKCEFKKWFFGHYHEDRAINEKEILTYEQIIRIV